MNSLMNALGNTSELIKNFINFAARYNRDPQTHLKELLDSGKVTQAQVDEATRRAKELEPFLRQFIK